MNLPPVSLPIPPLYPEPPHHTQGLSHTLPDSARMKQGSTRDAQGLIPLRWGCALPSPNAPGKAPNHIHTTLRWGRAPGYDGDLSLPLGLALGSPIFPSGCEGKLGVALESLQGLRDLT